MARALCRHRLKLTNRRDMSERPLPTRSPISQHVVKKHDARRGRHYTFPLTVHMHTPVVFLPSVFYLLYLEFFFFSIVRVSYSNLFDDSV